MREETWSVASTAALVKTAWLSISGRDWDDDEDDSDEIIPIDQELLHPDFSFEDENDDDEPELSFDFPPSGDLDDLEGDELS